MERNLMKGNEALAEAAIRAGCKCFFGYPITPQTEISAYMAKRMPKVGGVFLAYLREQSKQLRDCFGRRKRRAGSIEQRIGNIKKVCCEGQRPVSLVPAAVIEFVLTECDFQPAVAEKLRFVIGKQSVA